jgi:hypothetical protein
VPLPVTMPTCPGAAGLPVSTGKEDRSPGLTWLAGIFWPKAHWAGLLAQRAARGGDGLGASGGVACGPGQDELDAGLGVVVGGPGRARRPSVGRSSSGGGQRIVSRPLSPLAVRLVLQVAAAGTPPQAGELLASGEKIPQEHLGLQAFLRDPTLISGLAS